MPGRDYRFAEETWRPILTAFSKLEAQHGRPPTLNELAKVTGLPRYVVRYNRRRLIAEGLIIVIPETLSQEARKAVETWRREESQSAV